MSETDSESGGSAPREHPVAHVDQRSVGRAAGDDKPRLRVVEESSVPPSRQRRPYVPPARKPLATSLRGRPGVQPRNSGPVTRSTSLTGRPLPSPRALGASSRLSAGSPGIADPQPLARDPELDRIIDEELVVSVYQPIVELDNRSTVGYEALARGPEGSPLERPDKLFESARRTGRLADLDWLCRTAAVKGAMVDTFGASLTLFANVEPDALHVPVPASFEAVWRRARSRLGVIVELTERDLLANPAELLKAVRVLRKMGWGLALDDVGSDPRSIALMPFIDPDVIKLDMRLIQQRPTAEISEISNAVNAQAQSTGATVLAEGIETEQHVERALSFGATLGQGYLFARPGPLPNTLPDPKVRVPISRNTDRHESSTPFSLLSHGRTLRRGSVELLRALAGHIEQQLLSIGTPGVLLASCDAKSFEFSRHRYGMLARQSAFVAVVGEGINTEPAPRVRGQSVSEHDPLAREWSVIVIGPHFAGAIVARRSTGASGAGEQLYDFHTSYDRNLIKQAGRLLMERVDPTVV